jgi:hypothetical protein
MVGKILARGLSANQIETLEGVFLEAPQFQKPASRGDELDVVERGEVDAADLI